jgi:hypothetical protein
MRPMFALALSSIGAGLARSPASAVSLTDSDVLSLNTLLTPTEIPC